MELTFEPSTDNVGVFSFVSDGFRYGFVISTKSNTATVDWKDDHVEDIDISVLKVVKPRFIQEKYNVSQVRNLELYNAIFNNIDVSMAIRSYKLPIKPGDVAYLTDMQTMRIHSINANDKLKCIRNYTRNVCVMLTTDNKEIPIPRKYLRKENNDVLVYHDLIVVRPNIEKIIMQ